MSPPVLMDDLVEEILLRLPPNDPALLLRAALVCKDWCCLIAGSGFRRRFLKTHRTRPVLGFLYQGACPVATAKFNNKTHFMATSTSTFRLPFDGSPWRAIQTLQSRILFLDDNSIRPDFNVWNSITGQVWSLPTLPRYNLICCWSWSAALVCATAACDHLNCDQGPFVVVFVCVDEGLAHAFVYSSEYHSWSEPSKPISVQNHHPLNAIKGPGAHVGNAVFFEVKYVQSSGILKYDVGNHELSLLSLPSPSSCQASSCNKLMATDGGKLGLITTVYQGPKLSFRSREPLLDGGYSWAQRKVIELNNLVVPDYYSSDVNLALRYRTVVLSVTDVHDDVVFVRMGNVIFTVDLKSGGVAKVFDRCDREMKYIIPYVTFCTPGAY